LIRSMFVDAMMSAMSSAYPISVMGVLGWKWSLCAVRPCTGIASLTRRRIRINMIGESASPWFRAAFLGSLYWSSPSVRTIHTFV
jgi:hypothetical protein